MRIRNTIGRIIAYHGCDRSVAEKVLAGEQLKLSTNKYDWLGSGVYFWVDSPDRAMQWAELLAKNDRKLPPSLEKRAPIVEPAVVGALINPGLTLNLMDWGVMDEIRAAHDALSEMHLRAGVEMPFNSAVRKGVAYSRELDCAVIETIHRFRDKQNFQPYDCVLGVFEEGDQAYKGAAFRDQTHIQIAVRNQECILAYFRPKQ